jgi:hypothetical protein
MIQKLENKYFVLKRDDIDKYLSLEYDLTRFNQSVDKIYEGRMMDDKDAWNHYVVLNLNDEIDIDYLINALLELNNGLYDNKFKVENIAVMLINSVLNVRKEK